jgi:hypothetical protein
LIRTDEIFWPISAPFIHRKPTIEVRRKIMCGNNPLSLHYHIVRSGYKGKYKVRFNSSFSMADSSLEKDVSNSSKWQTRSFTGYRFLIQLAHVFVKYLKA